MFECTAEDVAQEKGNKLRINKEAFGADSSRDKYINPQIDNVNRNTPHQIEHVDVNIKHFSRKDPFGHVINQSDILSVSLIQKPQTAKYYCATCRIDFASDNILQAHLIFHTHNHVKLYAYNKSTNNYECSYCSVVHRNVESIEKHVLAHCIRRFICAFTDCSKRFISKLDLLLHQHIHCKKPEDSYICPTCSAALKNLLTLKMHIKEHSFVCGFLNCQEDRKTILDLAMHRASHFGSTCNFSCPLCKSPEMNKTEFDAHVSLKHPKIEFLCGFCGHLCKDETLHRTHQKEHCGNNYICVVCHKEFLRPQMLLKHQISEHPVESEPGYFCKYCIMEFESDDELSVHMTKCSLRIPRSQKTSKKSQYLMAHGVKILLNPNIPQNNNESKSMGNKTDVYSETTTTKTSEKQKEIATPTYHYACGSCSETFDSKREVDQHINQHHIEIANCYRVARHGTTNKGIINCPLCNFITTKNNDFKFHVFTFHKDYTIVQE